MKNVTMETVKQTTPQPATIVPNKTYDMIVDVLAGKIMTELSATRPGAAQETAIELFSLLDKGVTARGINTTYLAMQIMDIYASENILMGDMARNYFEQIADHEMNMMRLDRDALRASLLQITDYAEEPTTIERAKSFTSYLIAKSIAA